jgi:hypothetical protein
MKKQYPCKVFACISNFAFLNKCSKIVPLKNPWCFRSDPELNLVTGLRRPHALHGLRGPALTKKKATLRLGDLKHKRDRQNSEFAIEGTECDTLFGIGIPTNFTQIASVHLTALSKYGLFFDKNTKVS